MLNLTELEQFVTFADCGTLSKASEILHLSQPTLTRAMQHVEESFGVSLFHRGKNKIELTDTGHLAVTYAKKLLSDSEKAIHDVQSYERSLHTITVFSCAPAPLWSLLPQLSGKFPDNTISSKIVELDRIVDAVLSDECDIGILPYEYTGDALADTVYLQENLFICIPETNNLSKYPELTFEQLNGYNCLLRDKIGFWAKLCAQKMPASRFLVQTDEFAFIELIRTSTLFHFVTDLVNPKQYIPENRVKIPISSKEAKVTYHFIYKPDKAKLLLPTSVR